MLELLDVVGLHEEVHLLLGDRPHLVEDHAEVEDVLRVADDLQKRRRALHEHEVLAHDLVDARPLYLDDDLLAAQHGTVHLRDARRAQRLLVDGLEDLVPAAVVLLLDDLEDDGTRRWLLRRTPSPELIAPGGRKSGRMLMI